jgi:hypothetical protein
MTWLMDLSQMRESVHWGPFYRELEHKFLVEFMLWLELGMFELCGKSLIMELK